jgi:succinate dehydrogenase / fumarate reductase membrane anchor subunit
VTSRTVVDEGARAASWPDAMMSATSLALVVLLPVEIVVWVLATDVAAIDAQMVAERWQTPAWRALDLAFLVVAMVHGTAGLLGVVRSGVRSPASRSAGTGLVLAVSVAIVVLGCSTLLTFEVT